MHHGAAALGEQAAGGAAPGWKLASSAPVTSVTTGPSPGALAWPPQMTNRAVNPQGLATPGGALAQVVVSGDMAFVSGQCGTDETGATVAPDVAAQTTRALGNLATALGAVDFALDDVVQVTAFLADLADFDAYDAAYGQAFGEHRPARATVRADIHSEDLIVEIMAVARKG